MILRPYQSEALEACWDFLRLCDGNPALVLPTGAGKSPLLAALARQAVEQWQGRVCVLAHVQELVAQSHAAMMRVWPEAKAGIYAAGLKRRDRFEPILFCQIQSVVKKAAALGRFDLLLIDEAHRIPLAGDGMYRAFIDACRAINPALRVIGLTATPYRLQGAAVPVCGPENVLTDIAYEAPVKDLIEQGFLSQLVSKAGERPDLSAVHTRGGEYVERELAGAMMAGDLVPRTVADLLARSAGRTAGIVFCVSVDHAALVAAELAADGESVATVTGSTPKPERAKLIADFKARRIRWMVNVNVLTEGFDAPHIDTVAMLRPTKSPGLYYQMVGRGFRLAEGKTDCLVLDYAGNVLEHGPVDAIRVRPKRAGGKAEVETGKAKECPECHALLPNSARVCECGYQFASGEPKHFDRALDLPILSGERTVNRYDVRRVRYERHEKPDKPPSLRVTYLCGLRTFREWVCLEHAGMARAKAHRWWTHRVGGNVPRTVDEALRLAEHLVEPISIEVDETQKFPEIVTHEFDETKRERARATNPVSAACTESAGSIAHPDAVPGVRSVPQWLLRAMEIGSADERAA